MTMDYESRFAAFFGLMADAAGEIALKYFRSDPVVDEKEDHSPVTRADREIEAKLRSMIQQDFPSHGIVGEEYGRENEEAEFVWFIDPIDGTKSFAIGRPLFGTIIGLTHAGRPVAGLVDQAFTQERWFGIADIFCRHNGRRVKVAAPRDLRDARLYVGSPVSFWDQPCSAGYETLCRTAKWTQYSGDCYAYGLLACGWIDLVVERDLSAHDIVGIAPIVSGAGGFISNWNGGEVDASTDGNVVAASTRELAVSALDLLLEKS
ncbi:MAG TPA: inositol monophosphatase family protein [Rhizomicrobium sp.]|nr:inositol monophosphatase family protein [Rhizomicrobium sp.]